MAADDPFKSLQPGMESPAEHWAEVEPDDDNDLATQPRALWASAGDLALRSQDGTDIVLTIDATQIIPLRPVRVLETGTTSTAIIALW